MNQVLKRGKIIALVLTLAFSLLLPATALAGAGTAPVATLYSPTTNAAVSDNQKIIFFEDGSMDMGVYREADHQDWVKANSVWVPAPPKPQSIQSILFKDED